MKGGLALVRRFAEVTERMARRALAEAAAEVRAAEEQQEALARRALREREAIASRLAAGADVDRVGTGYRYVRAAEQQAAEAEARCDALRADLARRETAWMEARRTQRGMRVICERRARKAHQVRERREQQAVDDLVNAWGGGIDVG